MTHYEENCIICGDLVHSYDYSSGYGEHSHGHVRHKVYEKREFKTPETSFDFLICMDCSDNTAIKKIIRKFRLEWYDKEIISTEKAVKQKEYSIENLNEQRNELHGKIDELKVSRQILECGAEDES